MDYTELRPNQEIHANGIIYDLKSLLALLLRVTDTRKAKGKQYSLTKGTLPYDLSPPHAIHCVAR